MSHWKTGQKIQRGRYVIDRVLGYGGSGITYRALEQATGNFVAIKTLNAMIQNQADFAKHQERFIQEAFRLAKCNHQHVIQVDNVAQEGELWCMVMEYISGGTLSQYITHKSILSEKQALHFIQQIASALIYIHQQGFLHRDVKPANIMLRQSNLEAVLIDFGLAREFVQDRIQVHTNSRTESFAPPEQYEIRAKRGAYTDVYALASTLYYILTLQLPFPAPFRQQGAILIPPKQHNPHLSESVNRAILKGMELHPEARPQSVTEWLQLLNARSSDTPQRLNFRQSHQVIITPARQEQLTNTRTSQLPTKIPTKAISEETLPPFEANAVPKEEPVFPLISVAGIDYTTLQQLLSASQFQASDRETARLMLKIAGREKAGWLDKIHVDNFPCEELQAIDRLWVKASNGRFGFSAQKHLYESLGGTHQYNAEVWRRFGETVGWRKNGSWLSYKALNFNLWAPEGHLPMLAMHLWRFTGWITALVERLKICQIN